MTTTRTIMLTRSGAALLLLAAAGATGWAQDDSAVAIDTSDSEVRPIMARIVVDRGSLLRTYNLAFDPARAARLTRFHSGWLARLDALQFDALSQDGKIDYLLLRNDLVHQQRLQEAADKRRAATARFVPFAAAALKLERSRRAMEPVVAREAAASLDALRKQVEAVRKSIESEVSGGADHQTRVNGLRAAQAVAEVQAALRTWFRFYDGYDPQFTWWTKEPYQAADKALDGYAAFLREKVAGVASKAKPGDTADIVGDPIGRDGLLSELAHEMIPYTPEELIAIGEKEYEWCEREMKRASREMGLGDDWKAALEQVKNMYVEPGKQPEMIRDLAREAEKFLDDNNLITVPPLARETWRMQMMTPERQLVNPFFTGGETISVSFPTDTMTYDQRLMSMRGNNIPFSRATVFHELIPGHHLQGFMARRYRSYRAAVGGTPFFGEGWSLYWELLLWEQKFHGTPADRVGALFWRMHRCARIVFSLSFHLGKMTPREAIDYLVDKVGHERENAIGEVRRSFTGAEPLYQAAYLLGGLQLYALRQELVGPGKMSDREFHDALLRENSIPVELMRASLRKLPLKRDLQTSWRFYDSR